MNWGGRKVLLGVFTLVILFIHVESSLGASFLSQTDVLSDKTEQPEHLSQLFSDNLAFETLLKDNTFSAAWFTEIDHSKIPSFVIHKCSNETTQTPLSICHLELYNINTKSPEFKVFHISLNESKDTTIDSKNSTLVYQDALVQVSIQKNSSFSLEQTCSSDVIYYFINKKTSRPFNYTTEDQTFLSIQVALRNGDCHFDLVTTELALDRKSNQASLIKYSMLMTGVASIQIFSCIFLMRKLKQDSPIYKRTSIGTLSFLTTFDLFIYLLHFPYWAMITTWMAAVFISFFMVAIFFEPMTLYNVFTTLQRRTNTHILSLLFQLYTWFLISGGCFLLSMTYIPNLIFYAYPFFLIPQILDNVFSARKYKWNFYLIGGLGLPKLFYIATLSLGPVELFQKRLTPELMIFTCIILAIEFVILQIQTRYPTLGFKQFEIVQYSYIFHPHKSDKTIHDVCSICTEKVHSQPIIGIQQPLLPEDPETPSFEIYKTPCDHFYHSHCLQEWLKKKLECPNCRQVVPPLPDEEE